MAQMFLKFTGICIYLMSEVSKVSVIWGKQKHSVNWTQSEMPINQNFYLLYWQVVDLSSARKRNSQQKKNNKLYPTAHTFLMLLTYWYCPLIFKILGFYLFLADRVHFHQSVTFAAHSFLNTTKRGSNE